MEVKCLTQQATAHLRISGVPSADSLHHTKPLNQLSIDCNHSRRQQAHMEAHLRDAGNPTSWHRCCIQLAKAGAQNPEEVKTVGETQTPGDSGKSGNVHMSTWFSSVLSWWMNAHLKHWLQKCLLTTGNKYVLQLVIH